MQTEVHIEELEGRVATKTEPGKRAAEPKGEDGKTVDQEPSPTSRPPGLAGALLGHAEPARKMTPVAQHAAIGRRLRRAVLAEMAPEKAACEVAEAHPPGLTVGAGAPSKELHAQDDNETEKTPPAHTAGRKAAG